MANPCGEGAGHRRRHRRGRAGRVACAAGRRSRRGSAPRRCDDRQGDRRGPVPGRGHGDRRQRQRRGQARGGQRAGCVSRRRRRARAAKRRTRRRLGGFDRAQRRGQRAGRHGHVAIRAEREAARVALGASPRARAGRGALRRSAGPDRTDESLHDDVVRHAAGRGAKPRRRAALCRARRRTRGPGDRNAPADRAAHAGVAADSALHLRRGGRRHRARGPAFEAQRPIRRGARPAHRPAVPDAGDRACRSRVSADERAVRRRAAAS